jgi:hypothetical protein
MSPRKTPLYKSLLRFSGFLLIASGCVPPGPLEPSVGARGSGLPATRAGEVETVGQELAETLTRTVSAFVSELNGSPDALPQEPDGRLRVIAVDFDTGLRLPRGPFPVRDGSLAYDRQRASLRREPPDLWVVMTDPSGREPLYWVPVSWRTRVRLEAPGRGQSDARGVMVAVAPRPASVRLPFVPGALVVLQPAERPDTSIEPANVLAMPAAYPPWPAPGAGEDER